MMKYQEIFSFDPKQVDYYYYAVSAMKSFFVFLQIKQHSNGYRVSMDGMPIETKLIQ